MKSLDKGMLKSVAAFCVNFDNVCRDGADVPELRDLVIRFSIKMSFCSAFSDATRTPEQYGELMFELIKYLACEEDAYAGEEYDCYTTRQKLLIQNGTLKMILQRAADKMGEQFSEAIESLLEHE